MSSSASQSTRAIYLDSTGTLSICSIPSPYTPTADLRHFYIGEHSYITEYDFIGPVVSTSPGSPFQVGDVVFGLAGFSRQRPSSDGAHQDFFLAEAEGTFKLPADVRSTLDELTQVVSWPVGVQTAVDTLFNSLDFAFPPVASVKGADPKGRSILIGGSSIVGLFTIQLAKIAGFFPIYTTASPHNHATLLELGATACFDYRSPTVVDDIRAAALASGKELTVAFNAVTQGTSFGNPPSDKPLDVSQVSFTLARRCLTEGSNDGLRLCASLKVEDDPNWSFCLAVRPAEVWPEYHVRMKAILEWVYANHKTAIKVPKIRVIKGAEEGIKAIYDVFEGRVSMEKVVIEHPM
ncbi:uncharacterized protein BCR38DRAFT_462727 [Pseudomassariella vexata]|uniref:Alcohol dehydrogenase-like C-terminal domain-containing protein n=1 Tax=Pseudomassariella vexata TaxID=1141098 RepID=A0A1Y2EJ98_9PEZI|nr:uncharacterized protein BCR38DRAFT_462727 [Pseudomassariella vexata]ORY71631.1 hypothetical protein BCR38DRAFT_462727 [Pseudomassariella vexata]